MRLCNEKNTDIIGDDIGVVGDYISVGQDNIDETKATFSEVWGKNEYVVVVGDDICIIGDRNCVIWYAIDMEGDDINAVGSNTGVVSTQRCSVGIY